ncbi:MAG: hypothetical protein AB8B97_18355 [Granulosicoccus sp.]
MAASHGLTKDWNDSIWICQHPTPPLYPKLVTLKRNTSVDETIKAIDLQIPSSTL